MSARRVDWRAFLPRARREVSARAAESRGVRALAMGASAFEIDPLFAMFGFPPSGAIAETLPRSVCATFMTPGTGVMHLSGIYVPAGRLVTNVTFVSGATAEATGTHLWFALYDQNLNLLQQSVDDTVANSFGASTVKTKALTATVTTTYAGIYYVGFMCTAGTVPNLLSLTGSLLSGAVAPVMYGLSTSGLTTTAPSPAAAPAASINTRLYAYLS